MAEVVLNPGRWVPRAAGMRPGGDDLPAARLLGPGPACWQPSVALAKGSGSRRIYSYSDVLELKVIKQLLDAGVCAAVCSAGCRVASPGTRRRGRLGQLRAHRARARSSLGPTARSSTCSPAARRVQHRAAGQRGRRARGGRRAPRHGGRGAVAPGKKFGPSRCRPRQAGRSERSTHAHRRPATHPACEPAAQVRFAHPSERLFAALLDLRVSVGVRAGRVPPQMGRRTECQSPGSGPISTFPSEASLHRIDHRGSALGDPQERQGPAHA